MKASIRPATDGKPGSCLVEGYVNTMVNFAIIMPVSDWNGRYVVRGCGGSCDTVAIDIACSGHIKDGKACLHIPTHLVGDYGGMTSQVAGG